MFLLVHSIKSSNIDMGKRGSGKSRKYFLSKLAIKLMSPLGPSSYSTSRPEKNQTVKINNTLELKS